MPTRFNLLKALVGLSFFGLVGCGPATVATMEYVGVDPPQPKTGDVTTVSFKLTDYRGVPLAGAGVTFRLETDRPGVSLNPLATTSLKGSGLATTQLVVPSRVSTVVVIANAGDKEVRTPPISFAGSVANGRQLTFQCGELAGKASGGRHAIGTYDPSRNLIAGVKMECTAHIADRNGEGLAGGLISFLTEAGAIEGTGIAISDVVGNATILHKSSYPLPKEVTPEVYVWVPNNDESHTGQPLVPSWMEPYRWTTNPIGTLSGNPALNMANLQEPRRNDPFRKNPLTGAFYQNNPRDNLVTMIAVTSGEEGFTDSDNDGKWTDGEPYDDLTEPFVDSNDNGTWDADEKFIDSNANLKWDGKNGKWDANTYIWAQEKLLWTGVPEAFDRLPPFPTIREVQANDGMPIQIGCFESIGVNFAISDPWFNSLARNSDSDGCTGTSNEVVEINGGQYGTAFTYPPVTVTGFEITDALDRKPQPMTTPPQPGCFEPPGRICTAGGSDCYTFGVVAECKFTASPIEGHIVTILGAVRGRIFKNLP